LVKTFLSKEEKFILLKRQHMIGGVVGKRSFIFCYTLIAGTREGDGGNCYRSFPMEECRTIMFMSYS